MNTKKWGWLVFAIFVTAYLPFLMGGVDNPKEINVYSWGSWLLLSVLFLWSCKAQGFANWRMPLAYVVGNIAMLTLAFSQGGYTANLTITESIVFVGTMVTLSVWLFVGMTKNIWSPRIIFWGSMISDIITYYPQTKQYWGSNPMPGAWTMVGWSLALTGLFIQVFAVDQIRHHLKNTEGLPIKQRFIAFEPQIFGVEQLVTVSALISVMIW